MYSTELRFLYSQIWIIEETYIRISLWSLAAFSFIVPQIPETLSYTTNQAYSKEQLNVTVEMKNCALILYIITDKSNSEIFQQKSRNLLELN